MTKAKDLIHHSLDELQMLIQEKKEALFQMRNEIRRTKKLEKPHLIQQTRRDIARLLTVQHAKKASQREVKE